MICVNENSLNFEDVTTETRNDMLRWYNEFNAGRVKDWPYWAETWFEAAKIPFHQRLSLAGSTLVPKLLHACAHTTLKSKFFDEHKPSFCSYNVNSDLYLYQRELDGYEKIVEELATHMAANSGLGVSEWRSFVCIAASNINRIAAESLKKELEAAEKKAAEKRAAKDQKKIAKIS